MGHLICQDVYAIRTLFSFLSSVNSAFNLFNSLSFEVSCVCKLDRSSTDLDMFSAAFSAAFFRSTSSCNNHKGNRVTHDLKIYCCLIMQYVHLELAL